MQRNQTAIKFRKAKANLTGIFLFMMFSYSGFGQSYTPCINPVDIFSFGLDGDMYSNTPASISVDDWFSSSIYPGSALGVIGTGASTAKPPLAISAAAFKAIIQAGTSPSARNLYYQQGMSMPSGTAIGDILYIDAVGARDYTGVAGAKDSSIFHNGSSKNGDNPTTWNAAIGSTPNKNDLIDVGAHIRMNLSNGHLYGYAFATTLATDGNSHIDFEIFRTIPVLNSTTGQVSNTGPAATGGHTQALFNLDGSIRSTGDILIATDFSNGGTVAQTSVRVWINPSNIDSLGHDTTYLNSKPLRPFTFTGVFNSGNGSNGFGYAEIKPNNPSLANCLAAAVQNKVSTLASPWGSLSGPQGTFNSNLLTRQMTEISIDFTAFGISNTQNTSGDCEVFLGDLLIKTRSSQEFTAEQKDYSGPFPFYAR